MKERPGFKGALESRESGEPEPAGRQEAKQTWEKGAPPGRQRGAAGGGLAPGSWPLASSGASEASCPQHMARAPRAFADVV